MQNLKKLKRINKKIIYLTVQNKRNDNKNGKIIMFKKIKKD